MIKHVAPSNPSAQIPDPVRRDTLPPGGRDVEFTAAWIALARRGDIVVTDLDGTPVYPPAPPVYAAGDTLIVQRNGQAVELSGAGLLAYLAPLLGGTAPPATDNTLALTLDLGSSLAAL